MTLNNKISIIRPSQIYFSMVGMILVYPLFYYFTS